MWIGATFCPTRCPLLAPVAIPFASNARGMRAGCAWLPIVPVGLLAIQAP